MSARRGRLRTDAQKQKRLKDNHKYYSSPKGRAAHLLVEARRNSRLRGHPPPTLTVADLLPALEAGVCQLSGLPLDFSSGHGKGKLPRAPSLDRPDNDKHYTPDNFRIVCWALNAGLGAWGLEEASRIWGAVLSKRSTSGTDK